MGGHSGGDLPPGEKQTARSARRAQRLAALLTIVIICLIVFTPLAIILSSLAFELNVVYTKLQHNDTQFPTVVASLFAHLPEWAGASFLSIISIARNRFSASFQT